MWSDITLPPINLWNAPKGITLSRKDPFKTSLAANVFKQKYALQQSQSWYEKARDIVNDVCGVTAAFKYPLMSKEDREQLIQFIYELKFLPGGRYIYYAGRQARFYNNCFSADQEFITSEGVKAFNEFEDGGEAWVLSPVSGAFHQATVNCHGEQDLYEITFSNIRGRSEKTWTVKATRDHRWILKDGTETTSLKVGDVVPAGGYGMQMYDPKGWLHGAVFADGSVTKRKDSYSHQLRLCGEKSKYLEKLQNLDNVSVTYPPFAKGDPVLYITSPYSLKELPQKDESTIYISSFISGWVALDGHDNKVKQLHSINKEAMEYFSKYAYTAGLVVTGDLKVYTKDSNFGKRKPLYYLNFKSYNEFGGFKVISIKYLGKDKVWCVNEPRYNQFLLADGIVTGNCYLLKCEEDTREEWAAVTQRALSCLTTGGGIGIDYSVLRPAGRVLSRTGGLSSGPIPLMYIINEVGRNVMQGGSRRSAIYASLNWQHEDASDFLIVKNWDTQPITKDYSFWDAKMDNFNFPCPLDMTNISLNYDDAFLDKIGDYHEYNGNFDFVVNNNKSIPSTFLQNVEQALRTGEPGFSFNFGDKGNETLRNACTEVTSEDDSDCCNLGSVNIGNIESIEEFREVVRLAAMFLVCGTVRAQLPYQKVYDIREKNRRLGLGLMGMHEWLLKRGYKYEVVPELHKWLEVYRDESERSANTHCSRFYLSKPVAYRAIAPTGTIGILAGTTTGIEPLFAVAYKRRYLVDGTKWKYEYVVDSTADLLIKEYGLDPSVIETASDLAKEPERRIKFQADVQDYVDMSISSTINLPAWGSEYNNPDKVMGFAITLSKYAHRLRGFTCYPDGSRGGQPITTVDYNEAIKHKGVVYEENDSCKGGVCGI